MVAPTSPKPSPAVKHIRIKPYTPQTNSKAERFIQTALREWAYATAFEHSEQRYAALPAWLIATTGTALMLASHASHRSANSV